MLTSNILCSGHIAVCAKKALWFDIQLHVQVFSPFQIQPISDPVMVCVSNCLNKWGDAQGSHSHCYWSARQSICCQKHLACSFCSLAKKNMSSLSFHLNDLVKWMGRWRGRASQTERGRERRLGGSTSWFKETCNHRGQEAEAVSPLCLFDLPLTWVYLKPDRDNSTNVWCVLQHWPPKAACCASWHKLKRAKFNVTKPWLIHQYNLCFCWVRTTKEEEKRGRDR